MAPRILHISPWKVPCGVANYCGDFVESLNRIGFTNDVYPLVAGAWPEMLPVEVDGWLNDIVKKAENFDLVHIQHEHGLFGYAVGPRFSASNYSRLLTELKSVGIPSVTTFHSDVMPERQRRWRRKLKLLFKPKNSWKDLVSPHFQNGDSHRALVHTHLHRKSFVQQGFAFEAVDVVPIACLPPRQTSIEPSVAKKSLGLTEDAKLVSMFGFMGRYKGQDLAIEALQMLPTNYHLALVGGLPPESRDDFLDVLLRMIPESLRHRVTITGWVDRETADQYFAASDVCIAPYRADTNLICSGAVTWALSSGKPVIASKIEAFINVNRRADCFHMFTPGCVAELGWAIQKVVNDPRLQERLVRNAHDFCISNSWGLFAQAVVPIYRKLGVDVETEIAQPILRAA